jgi:hypothetical protein
MLLKLFTAIAFCILSYCLAANPEEGYGTGSFQDKLSSEQIQSLGGESNVKIIEAEWGSYKSDFGNSFKNNV